MLEADVNLSSRTKAVRDKALSRNKDVYVGRNKATF